MSNKKRRDIILGGFTLFAMYLGASNILFPPSVGIRSGTSWLIATLGFILTGVGVPLLGSLAMTKTNGDPDGICKRSWPVLNKALNIIILIMIGPLFAIPRTAATTREIFIQAFNLPDNTLTLLGISIIFFTISFLLCIYENKILDRIGGMLAPLLSIFILVIVVLNIIKPIGNITQESLERNVFYYGFSSGYLTMDGLGSLLMGSAIATFFFKRGYSIKESMPMLRKSTIITGLLLSFVYLSYSWIGATASTKLSNVNDITERVSSIAYLLLGNEGRILLALIILFACLTTSAGLSIAFAQYFNKLSKNKISYKALLIIATLISLGISLLGVNKIIILSVPILELVYPLVIVLILIHHLSRFIPSDAAVKGIVVGTSLICIIMGFKNFTALKDIGNQIINSIPLGKEQFGYIIPAILFGVLFHFADKIIKKINKSKSPN